MEKSESDFQAVCRILELNVAEFWKGSKDSYRVVATQLRVLLCDRNPLLPRVRPDFKLHMLDWTEKLERSPSLADGLEVMMPGRLTLQGDGSSHFQLLFAQSKTLMKPEEWVEQPFLNPEITIRHLIKSVADKESVHSDPEYDDTLLRAKVVRYANDESHMLCIVAIGEYLVNYLRDSGELA